jgi:integrase
VSVNRDLALLRKIFNLARKWGKHRGDNPVSISGLLPEDNAHVAKFLPQDQAKLLLENIPQETRLIFEFALASGYRISNVLNLRWDQIDRESKLVSLPKTKSGRALRMPLNDWMAEILDRVPRRLGSPFVFCRLKDGKPYSRPHRAFKRALVDAGLDPKIRIHDLRHSFASWAAASGVPTSVLRDLLGHSTMAMVGRYAHSGHSTLVEMANRVTSPFGKDANQCANTGSGN